MAEKALQAVRYSVTLRPNPMDKEEPKKAYANLQLTDVLTIEQLAEHIQDHNTSYSYGTVIGVIAEMTHCIKELLMQGFKVSLGQLGSFSPAISCNGASSIEKFTEENIKHYGARYTMSPAFRDMRPKVTFKRVAARWQEDRLNNAIAKGETTVDITPAKAEDDTTPNP